MKGGRKETSAAVPHWCLTYKVTNNVNGVAEFNFPSASLWSCVHITWYNVTRLEARTVVFYLGYSVVRKPEQIGQTG